MTTITIISGGISRSNLSCGLEERLSNSSSSMVDQPLFMTTENRIELSFDAARCRLTKIKTGEPSEGRWKSIVFFLAMSAPSVDSISFIPSKLDVYQKLFATRGNWSGYLKVEEYGLFWQRRDLRLLNDFSGLEAEDVEIAKEVVSAFTHDEMTDAIAVTFKHRFDQGVDTFIWAKKPVFQ